MTKRAHAIPEAWPLFLTKEQLSAYLGMDYRTITMICPVRPLDFGKRMVLYHRDHIDAWAAGLKTRLPAPDSDAPQNQASDLIEMLEEARDMPSLDRVRARIAKSKARCRKRA